MNAILRGKPTLLGVPLDANSSFLTGPAAAPPLIRQALASDSANSWTEGFVDLGAEGAWGDAGDLELCNETGSLADFDVIETAVGQLLDAGQRPVVLGGDHSITYPVLRAVGSRVPGLTLVHFDAHSDLYDELLGNRLSHASPFARIMEEKLAGRLVQIGIRTMNGHQRQQADKFGVEVHEMKSLPAPEQLAFAGPVYISFDMDVLEPGMAPGVSHWEPGGLTTREALRYIQAIQGEIVGADVVEFNPTRDSTGMTAMVAAKVVKELLGKMIAG
jgi:agmatinase